MRAPFEQGPVVRNRPHPDIDSPQLARFGCSAEAVLRPCRPFERL